MVVSNSCRSCLHPNFGLNFPSSKIKPTGLSVKQLLQLSNLPSSLVGNLYAVHTLTKWTINFFWSISGSKVDDKGRRDRLVTAFKDPMTECWLRFISHVIHKFETVNRTLQQEDAIIHLLHDQLRLLYQTILSCFVEGETAFSNNPVDLSDPELPYLSGKIYPQTCLCSWDIPSYQWRDCY